MLSDVWQDFLTIVKEEAGSRVVETWLKAVVLQEWDAPSQKVYVKAPNGFVKDWIEGKYAELFRVHLGRLLNTEQLKVAFIGPIQEEATPKSYTSAVHTSQSHQSHTELAPLESFAARSFQKFSKIKQPLVIGGAHQLGRLNPSYTFETFVVGPNNSLSYAAAQAVVEDAGTHYNPLFIYAGSGLGKTHLLHAIGNAIQVKNPQALVLYQTTDRFINEFISAIRFNKIHFFQEKYRKLDVLLIDDIQFISNKEQTQEAFFHIFNALHDSKKQIVFTSDVFPRHINGLEERLRSRLEWGLVTDIHKPPLETKMAILKKKAALHKEYLDDQVAEYVALHVNSNIRELEGSLVRVLAHASLTRQPLTLELVKKVLQSSRKHPDARSIDFNKIASCVGSYFDYSLCDLRSESRAKDLSLARQIAMYLMKEMTDRSLKEIGAYLGRKNHTTVMHAYDRIGKSCQGDKKLKETLHKIKELILQ